MKRLDTLDAQGNVNTMSSAFVGHNFGSIDNLLMTSFHDITPPRGRLNKKDGLTRYGNSHVKDKTS